jgi:F-type H+-transporting ATPase subunit epsilon
VAVQEHPKGSLRSGNIADELAHPVGHLDVTLVSPARPIYSGDAHWVTVPAVNGQLGIWPRHAPIVAALGSGPLRIGLEGGRVATFAVHGGFLEVANDQVTILVDSAVTEDNVNVAEAKSDLDKTLAALQHPRSDEEFEELMDNRTWDETQLKLAKH